MIEKVEYIADMGFTAVQMLPTTEFSGLWGYNPRQMHAVHGPYGSPEDFVALVNKCHEHGIAVLIDVALHHGAARLNSLWEYDGWNEQYGGIYFEGAGKTPWGTRFAMWKHEVRDYLADSVVDCFAEYNVDGRRGGTHRRTP